MWEAIGDITDVNAALAAVAFTPNTNNDVNTTITTHIEGDELEIHSLTWVDVDGREEDEMDRRVTWVEQGRGD